MQWRRAAAALALLAAGACSGDDGLVEVQAITGLLDCPTAEFSYSTGDWDPNTPKAPTPEAALASLTPALGLPPGTPRLEAEGPDAVSYLFTDAAGHRLGRAGLTRTPGGWVVATTERCA